MDKTARLLVACADRPGIVAKTTGFLFAHGANITSLQEYSTDPEGGRFFMRVVFTTRALDVSRDVLAQAFAAEVAAPFAMAWRLAFADHKKVTSILVSREDHALLELLWRHRRGELPADIRRVVSNHPDHAEAVADFGIPFVHVPVTTGDAASKSAAEATMMALCADSELVVLARYMQILTAGFVAHFAHRIINIHHSFLPAFVGAKPYHQAHARGVKLIGATAHYVTADLDQGPIIEQDVARVSHRSTPGELIRIGRSIEREVLARAVLWHLEDRVLVHGNKTVVFS